MSSSCGLSGLLYPSALLPPKKKGSGHGSFPVRFFHQARCECVAHILQTLTDLDLQATVMSAGGVGTYDLISGNVLLEGFLRMEGGDQRFLSEMFPREPIQPSTSHKRQGGEQGDLHLADVVRSRTTRGSRSHPCNDEGRANT